VKYKTRLTVRNEARAIISFIQSYSKEAADNPVYFALEHFDTKVDPVIGTIKVSCERALDQDKRDRLEWFLESRSRLKEDKSTITTCKDHDRTVVKAQLK